MQLLHLYSLEPVKSVKRVHRISPPSKLKFVQELCEIAKREPFGQDLCSQLHHKNIIVNMPELIGFGHGEVDFCKQSRQERPTPG